MMSSNAIFVPATLSCKLKNMPVRSIYVAALPPACVTTSPKFDRSRACSTRPLSNKNSNSSDNSDNMKRTNHWVLYLLTYPETSIRLEFGRFGARPAVLLLQSLKYVKSNKVAKVFSLATKKGTTVQTIFDVIVRSRCDRYHFAIGGQGSRYWMYCLLFLLRGLDVIESRIDTVISGLQSVWMDGSLVPANSQTGIIPGYFY